MLNNRVRFGNMKRVNRAVWALSVILMMVLGLVLAGCSGSSDGADGKEESTYSKIVAIAKKGRSLADVKDELKDAGFSSSDYEVKSDTDKMGAQSFELGCPIRGRWGQACYQCS